MTAAHAYTIGKAESPACQCGAEVESVRHLIFECPLRGPCPVEILSWKDRPRCFSMACLCPLKADRHEVSLWRLLCRRAIHVLSTTVSATPDIDWKGHIPLPDVTGQQVYCIRCLVSRKALDAKHIAAKPCVGDAWGAPVCEGDYVVSRGHCFRLVFRPWKNNVRRPSLACAKCLCWQWPAYSAARACPF